ncbi:PQQ-binding-like beta-propeller repeat protein [Agriterribacter sp.]|uniref:outer membrane protein assembly factor BamB family protein n=1 Tax=Agriterribacter sp. TaxID=2821509 RepID=UPI002C68BE45|nr:PQQ-binding-like beta-propeller repeat protein [Agriterribacter sp.]HRP57445.1 PQQ-binding-like beta-propeller repeat protein [Agriterribacter sp.]
MKLYRIYILLLVTSILQQACNSNESQDQYSHWSMVNGNYTGNKYSSLAQIDTGNVKQLQVAWTYHTGDADTAAHSQIQCNPIVVNGIMYAVSPKLKLLALDAATGKPRWVFLPYDTTAENNKLNFNLNNNRGVAYWSDGKEDKRLFYVVGEFIYAVDAGTGKRITGFGKEGKVDLHEGLGEQAAGLFVSATSAPTVYKDLLLTGTRVSEGMDAAPGHIRAFDVRTGQMKWIFHTIPQPGEPGYETWEDKDAWKMTGGANNWMGMTIDRERGIAYAPTGSAAMDFYGGKRLGANLYADCLLALDAATGKLRWHFQYIHHDTWDYDPSSAPVLLTVTHNGKKIDAVAQTTKTGFVFIFNRDTGEPLFPVVETPVDTSDALHGEKLWPTQPIPQKPAPFVRQSFLEKDINPYLLPEELDEVKKQLQSYRTGKMFMPGSLQGTVVLPGFDGGGEWGGPAVDPETGMLYVNASEMAWILKMEEVKKKESRSENYLQAGQRLYQQHCTACHGKEMKGGGNYPSILGMDKKYNQASLIEFINKGQRMMPAFSHLKNEEKKAIASVVLNLKNEYQRKFEIQQTAADIFRELPYRFTGYDKFLTKTGKPALAPPWGTLTAIDLNTGGHLWKTVLGEDPVFKEMGVKETGTENYGGPVVTKTGLLFIAATKDSKFRAFNKSNGQLLWETTLPAPGFATPAMYEVNGKQFIVIACGGGKLGTASGDAYVAFALP